jgi:hypothetical protein
MNLATETGISTHIHPALLTDGLARTDQEFWRQSQPKSVPMEAPWTRVPEKERGAIYGYRLIRIDGITCVVYEIPVDTTPDLEVSRMLQKAVWVTGATADKHYAWLANSTVQQERPQAIDQEITIMFESAKEQDFEDGMESEFSRSLVSLVRKYGNAVMEIVAGFIIYERVNAEVASEALRWLGRMDDPTSYHFRRWLLERSLGCSSAIVRDGAALGLASVDDPHAIPYLRQAILRENYTELSEDMEQVLAQLEKAN